MVVVKRRDSALFLDIMGSAGGAGMFNFDFWSEQGYIKKVRKILDDYCEDYGISLEELPRD